jgi:hypothetical protein
LSPQVYSEQQLAAQLDEALEHCKNARVVALHSPVRGAWQPVLESNGHRFRASAANRASRSARPSQVWRGRLMSGSSSPPISTSIS